MKYLCSKKVLVVYLKLKFDRVTLFIYFFEIFSTLPNAIAYALHDKKLMK